MKPTLIAKNILNKHTSVEKALGIAFLQFVKKPKNSIARREWAKVIHEITIISMWGT